MTGLGLGLGMSPPSPPQSSEGGGTSVRYIADTLRTGEVVSRVLDGLRSATESPGSSEVATVMQTGP